MPDVPEPLSKFPIRNGVLQGDLDCAGHTLFNVDLTGLNLTKASVGLGNVDNTSDLAKPISTATQAALDLKENLIAAGTTGQFWRGDKTWLNYGSFALQGNITSYSLITVRGDDASTGASVRANRNDYSSSLVTTYIQQAGASVAGNIVGGGGPNLPAANVGMLAFDGAAYGLIRTNNSAPIVFAVNNYQRMRLQQGLNVGGLNDPGAGCITCYDTITAGAGFVGIRKENLPAALNQIQVPSIVITGTGGLGYILLSAQTSNPSLGGANIFADSTGKVSFGHSGIGSFAIKLDNSNLSADRIYSFLNVAGLLPVAIATPPTASGDPGVTGSIAYNTGFLFVCVAPSTWRRVAIAAF